MVKYTIYSLEQLLQKVGEVKKRKSNSLGDSLLLGQYMRTLRDEYGVKDKALIPNSEGFELTAHFDDGSSKRLKVIKNKEGLHTLPSYRRIVGWSS